MNNKGQNLMGFYVMGRVHNKQDALQYWTFRLVAIIRVIVESYANHNAGCTADALSCILHIALPMYIKGLLY